MQDLEIESHGNVIVAYNKSLFQEFSPDLFCLDYLSKIDSYRLKSLNSGATSGRGGVYSYHYSGRKLVLRHYFRGGYIAKFTKDSYLWQGLQQARSISELSLLTNLYKLELPVPIPIAARVEKHGLTYCADIITELIPDSQPLSIILRQHTLVRDVWRDIGHVIKMLHKNFCNHADLNAHNILIDDTNKIHLIDFDKSKIEKNPGTWSDNNLARLERSFIKLKKSEGNFYYTKNDFTELLEGYKNS